MSFDLYAAAVPEQKPPAIPNLRWTKIDDGTYSADFEYVWHRIWTTDFAALQAIGFGTRPGRSASASPKVHFDPTVASPRRVSEVIENMLEKHAAYIADRARIEAKHSDMRRRRDGAIERGRAVLDRYGEAFSRCASIKTLISQYHVTDSDKLQIDRLCDAVEAAAAKRAEL